MSASTSERAPDDELGTLLFLRDMLMGALQEEPSFVCENCDERSGGAGLNARERIAAVGELRQILRQITAMKKDAATGKKGAGGKLANLQDPAWKGDDDDGTGGT